MIYLSGQVGVVLRYPRPNFGVMAGPRSIAVPQFDEMARLGIWWAADNDAFNGFDERRWLDWLASVPDAARALCLFAAAPDVVGDARATLERSLPYIPMLRDLGYPVAFVAQDGVKLDMVPWPDIDALFVGGTTAFKLAESTYRLVAAAKELGLWTHMGRVNGEARLRAAAASGYDSADGTKLCFGPDANWPIVRGWLSRLDGQTPLWEAVS